MVSKGVYRHKVADIISTTYLVSEKSELYTVSKALFRSNMCLYMATEAPVPYHEKRPWGEFVQFTKNTSSTVKIITVNPGESLSLQHHKGRDEFWHVISGEGSATIGDASVPMLPDSNYFVPRETNHRLIGGSLPLVILEIGLGDFDENDIVRLEDKYGRSNKNT